jgi:hypothetical protein
MGFEQSRGWDTFASTMPRRQPGQGGEGESGEGSERESGRGIDPWSVLAKAGLSVLAAERRKQADREGQEAAEAQARAIEEQARLAARAERERTLREADQAREQAQRSRARGMVALGASNLALQGTPLTLADAQRAAGEEAVQGVIEQGLENEEGILSLGARRAAAARARAAAAKQRPRNSLLGQGGGLFETPSVL